MEDYETALRSSIVIFTNVTNLIILLTMLVSENVIELAEMEYVKSRFTSAEQSAELFQILVKKGGEKVPVLLQCLERSGNDHVAKYIRTKLVQNLEEQRKNGITLARCENTVHIIDGEAEDQSLRLCPPYISPMVPNLQEANKPEDPIKSTLLTRQDLLALSLTKHAKSLDEYWPIVCKICESPTMNEDDLLILIAKINSSFEKNMVDIDRITDVTAIWGKAATFQVLIKEFDFNEFSCWIASKLYYSKPIEECEKFTFEAVTLHNSLGHKDQYTLRLRYWNAISNIKRKWKETTKILAGIYMEQKAISTATSCHFETDTLKKILEIYLVNEDLDNALQWARKETNSYVRLINEHNIALKKYDQGNYSEALSISKSIYESRGKFSSKNDKYRTKCTLMYALTLTKSNKCCESWKLANKVFTKEQRNKSKKDDDTIEKAREIMKIAQAECPKNIFSLIRFTCMKKWNRWVNVRC